MIENKIDFIEHNKWTKELEKNYSKEVVVPIYGDVKLGGISSQFTENKLEKTMIHPPVFKTMYANTKYHYDGNDYFIHYTSLEKLISILNEKAIRLYDFNTMADPQEFAFSAKRILGNKYQEVDNVKKTLLSFSFCPYDLNQDNDDFNMWRLYGANGKGVAIIFKVHDFGQRLWNNFFLAKVNYGVEELNTLEKHIDLHNQFVKKHLEGITMDITPILTPLFGFHKIDIFQPEDEYRILKYIPGLYKEGVYFSDKSINLSVNNKMNISCYTSIPVITDNIKVDLENKMANDSDLSHNLKSTPHILIQKILIGYQYPKENEDKLITSILTTIKKQFDIYISVTPTAIKKKFED